MPTMLLCDITLERSLSVYQIVVLLSLTPSLLCEQALNKYIQELSSVEQSLTFA